LIEQKCLTPSHRNKVSVIYDGFPPSSKGPIDIKPHEDIDIIFSHKISADEFIRKILEHSASPKDIIVVSDDREIRQAANLFRAKAMGIEDFLGLKRKIHPVKSMDSSGPALNYSQAHKINEELRKIWLK